MKPYDKKWKKALATTWNMLLGNALLAFLVAAFIIPHNIVMGGTTGIAIVLHRFFPIFEVSYYVFGMNVILLILGLIFLGRKMFFTTIASSLIYPVMLWGIQRIPGIDSLTDDHLMAAIFAGVLMGIALGLVMRVGSSTGGMDILNLIFAKVFHLPVALFVYIADLIVVGVQAFFNTTESLLLGIVVLVLESLVLNRAMLIGKSQIQLYIISRKYEQIRDALLNEIEAGVTLSLIETGRLGESQKGVLCVIPPRKQYDATTIIHDIDPEAFITISSINEVKGRGFTVERRVINPGETEKE